MCSQIDPTKTPSGRVETCVTCGEPLTLEMEQDFPFICVECQRDLAEIHSVITERTAS